MSKANPSIDRLRLVLASASPRRLDLLSQMGITPDAVIPADVNETLLDAELPGPAAKRLARLKAEDIADKEPGSLILAADTLVALGRRVLGKPADEAEARKYLSMLSGRRHQVYGGICLIDQAGKVHERLIKTQVSFKRLEQSEIDGYIVSGEWQGKAGAYAIQGLAGAFVKAVNGSYANVVGLALYETNNLLKGVGYTR